jgi:hypothetical protein
MAYVLLCAWRRLGLYDTEFAGATCHAIRLKFSKIGALVRMSVPPRQDPHCVGLPNGGTVGVCCRRARRAAPRFIRLESAPPRQRQHRPETHQDP